ncbi:MAG: hypothetical protein QCI38_01750 [Candidatus Thermoplasmatota archaeon]|nr:hypothetical protein [Candidatus Thermoplasmatota archaeon]
MSEESPKKGNKAVVECRYKDQDGNCTGRYDGYACLEMQCPFYRMIMEGKCGYIRDGYCTYYKRFGCPGLGKCEATFGMRLVEKE